MDKHLIDFVSNNLKKSPLPATTTTREELPPGWIKKESRSKPGAFYYAHPSTNRTSSTAPPGTRRVALSADELLRNPAHDSKGGPLRSSKPAALREKSSVTKEIKRGEDELEEEDEAEAALVQKMKKQAIAAKKAKEEEEQRKKDEMARLEKERKEREKLEKQRREAEEALAAEKRKQESEIRKKEEEAKKRKNLAFEIQLRAAEEAKRKHIEEEEQRKLDEEKANMKATLKQIKAREAKQVKVAAKDAALWNQIIPDLNYQLYDHCFEVFRSEERVARHKLRGSKNTWIIGRGPEGVDVVISNQRISRKHAKVTSQGGLMFLTDLGSTYGTAVDGEKLEKNSPMELSNNARCRFGGLYELYVYREPNAHVKAGVKPYRARDEDVSMYADKQADEFDEAEMELSPDALNDDLPPCTPCAASPGSDLDNYDVEVEVELGGDPEEEMAATPQVAVHEQALAEQAAKAAEEAAAVQAAEDDDRVRRIQQKREERKAARNQAARAAKIAVAAAGKAAAEDAIAAGKLADEVIEAARQAAETAAKEAGAQPSAVAKCAAEAAEAASKALSSQASQAAADRGDIIQGEPDLKKRCIDSNRLKEGQTAATVTTKIDCSFF
eukprot:TRINITY_DN76066_c0_g1_i1.p1 TRINITY_DN76066_c0_g1~~TRINITY_DN76066_c0_g1_i1.p1  ORF type:complete len:613 (+),score=164.67 TRINITY_DN76066_c0_g1_i1:74-1912(+)